MKVGGQILWNVTPICETSQIYHLMGRRPMKDVLGNHLMDLLFRRRPLTFRHVRQLVVGFNFGFGRTKNDPKCNMVFNAQNS